MPSEKNQANPVKVPLLDRLGCVVPFVDVALILTGLAVLFTRSHSVEGDGHLRFKALAALIDRGQILDVKYSMVGPLFSSLLYAVGKACNSAESWTAKYNWLVFSVGLLFMYRVLRGNIEGGVIRKFLLLLVFASMFPNHQLYYYGEVFTAMAVGLGILCITFNRPIAGWTCLILGVANTPASIIGLALVAITFAARHRRVRYLLAPVGAVVLIMAESFLKRGHLFASGYEGNAGFRTSLPYSGQPGFSFPFIFGLLSILFSFGKGILWYCPGLLISVRAGSFEKENSVGKFYALWMVFLAGLVLVYSKWWSWYGGWFWGPRFFLFACIPAAFSLSQKLSSRSQSLLLNLAVLLTLSWSFWVGYDGLVPQQSNSRICTENHYALESLCWYVPLFAPLFRPFVTGSGLRSSNLPILIYYLAVLLYLAAPIILRIFMATGVLAGEVKARYLTRSDWRL